MSSPTLRLAEEWTSYDPFGRIKPTDETGAGPAASAVHAPRGGYASLRLLIEGAGEFRVGVEIGGGLEVDLYRVWYHRRAKPVDERSTWLPDALLPLPEGALRIPDPDNQVPGQTLQELWIDIYAPADAEATTYAGRIVVSGSGRSELGFELVVLEERLPDQPCVFMDSNSYGAGMSAFRNYPAATGGDVDGADERAWRKAIEVLQHQHRLAREHRTSFHNLTYSQQGTTNPIYAPRAEGRGRERRLVDWELYDAHYGPLLDGSAYRSAAPGMPRPRQAAAPSWGLYTPINANWPARYVNWGEEAYREEFRRGLAQYDEHLRARGWTRTPMEFFLNHKKRYRTYEWDGDECKYAKDHACHEELLRLFRPVQESSPVPWVYRADISWQLREALQVLHTKRTMFVCGSTQRWFPEELAAARGHGSILWWYQSWSPMDAPTSGVLQNLWKTWARGFQGFCQWNGTSSGDDPWFAANDGHTTAWYPGERFGIPGPLPSLRLKILRNGIQDLDVLEQRAQRGEGVEALRAECAAASPIRLWSRRPAVCDILPPEDWDSRNLGSDHEPVHKIQTDIDSYWWREIRRRSVDQEVTA